MNKDNLDDIRLLAETLPAVSQQMRSSLNNFYAAFERIATPERRAEDPELDRQSALLQQSYFRMLRLANNLTHASRLVEEVSLSLYTLDLAAVVKEIYQECLPHAETMGLQLHFRCEGAPLIADANRDGIRCVLYHFLSNAFKFTKAGKNITIYCRKEGNNLLLSVEDEGCGINELSPDLLFERYLQNDPYSPPPHGLGLGLPVARQTARAMGGQILLNSRESGACATLILPTHKGSAILQEPRSLYIDSFPHALVGLSDALPLKAFLQNPMHETNMR